eukprot:TRINITY_DN7361_c0_g1_i1.p1 TRINITY_DN7361_c0_g1~~TRINITY_DN7361_c0_g1_i1.p1  ORF type:complete len:241 (+),score=52.12 TRINITY_DN7361_c0_g1_i1:277-999(+)
MTKSATVAASDDVEPPAKRIRHTLTPRTLSFVFDSPDCNRVLLITYGPEKKSMAGWSNGLGGHVEAGEDIVESGLREVSEESGSSKTDFGSSPRLAGVVHVSNFFGASVAMFVLAMHVTDKKSPSLAKEWKFNSKEGEVIWSDVQNVLADASSTSDCDSKERLKLFADLGPLLRRCLPRENGTCSVWTATSNFDGAGKLLKLSFREPLEKERGNAVVEKSSAEVRSNHISELPASSVWDF